VSKNQSDKAGVGDMDMTWKNMYKTIILFVFNNIVESSKIHILFLGIRR